MIATGSSVGEIAPDVLEEHAPNNNPHIEKVTESKVTVAVRAKGVGVNIKTHKGVKKG